MLRQKSAVSKEKYEEFGRRLAAVREQLALKNKDFAAAIGVSESHTSQAEKGLANPTFEFFTILCERFRVSMDYLFYGKGEMFLADEKEVGENEPEVKPSRLIEEPKDLLWYMEHSKTFYHGLLLYAQSFYFDHEKHILQELELRRSMKESEGRNKDSGKGGG